MHKVPLGIKFIGIFFIISAIWNSITQIIIKNYILGLFFLLINLIVGINLIRRRKFAIFIAGFSIISFIIFMVTLPIVGLNARKNYEERQVLYEQLVDQLNKLKNENSSKAEIIETEEKITRLKRYINWYENFEKSGENLQSHFNVEVGIVYLSFFGVVIYYLRKSYVRDQFKG